MFNAAFGTVKADRQMEEEKKDNQGGSQGPGVDLLFFRCVDQFRSRWCKLALLIILLVRFFLKNKKGSECP